VTIDRSTLGTVWICAMETIAFEKSTGRTFPYYGFPEW
jgi:hypothetical protein